MLLKYFDGKLICVVESSILSRGYIAWYKDNEEITDSNLLINPKTLSLTHVKDNDEHEYTCKFVYNLTSVFSETMLIKRNKRKFTPKAQFPLGACERYLEAPTNKRRRLFLAPVTHYRRLYCVSFI